jgi:hypothetical protein
VIIAALVTVSGVVIVAVLNSRTDDLKRAERLSVLAEKMKRGPERAFVERTRDDYVVRWTLRAASPKFSTMRIWIVLLSVYAIGALWLAVFITSVDPAAEEYMLWILMGAAVLALGSFGVSVLRLRAQRKWVKAEREARAIDPPQNRRLWLEYEDRDGPDRKVG